MALEGLYLMKDQGQTFGTSADLKYPDLKKMLDYICSHQPKLLDSTELREEKLIFPSNTYVAMIKFLMKCFVADSSIYNSDVDVDVSCSPVVTMCLLLEHAMAFEGSAELHATALKALVEIGSHLPQVFFCFGFSAEILSFSFSLQLYLLFNTSFSPPVGSITLCGPYCLVETFIRPY